MITTTYYAGSGWTDVIWPENWLKYRPIFWLVKQCNGFPIQETLKVQAVFDVNSIVTRKYYGVCIALKVCSHCMKINQTGRINEPCIINKLLGY